MERILQPATAAFALLFHLLLLAGLLSVGFRATAAMATAAAAGGKWSWPPEAPY